MSQKFHLYLIKKYRITFESREKLGLRWTKVVWQDNFDQKILFLSQASLSKAVLCLLECITDIFTLSLYIYLWSVCINMFEKMKYTTLIFLLFFVSEITLIDGK